MRRPIVNKKRIVPKKPVKMPAKKKAPKRWDAIIKHIGKGPGLVGAEIGVDTGKTCKVLFEKIPGIFLYLVDRWIETPKGDSYFQGSRKLAHEPQKYFDKAYNGVKAIAKPYKHKILKMDSVEAAQHVKDDSLDFVFIDGDHSYVGTKRDIKAWLPKVKEGGWICGHDYDNQNTLGDVKSAVDEMFKDVELCWNTTWFHKVTIEDKRKLLRSEKVEPAKESLFIISEIEETENDDWSM